MVLSMNSLNSWLALSLLPFWKPSPTLKLGECGILLSPMLLDSNLSSPLLKLCISSCDSFEFLAFLSICLTNVVFWCLAWGWCGVYFHALLCFFKHQMLAASPLICESSSKTGAFYSFEIWAPCLKRQKNQSSTKKVLWNSCVSAIHQISFSFDTWLFSTLVRFSSR